MIKRDLEEYKKKKEEKEADITIENVDKGGTTTTTTTTTTMTTKVETVIVKEKSNIKNDTNSRKLAESPLNGVTLPSKSSIESAPSGTNTPTTDLDDNLNQPDSVDNMRARRLGASHLRGENCGDAPPAHPVSADDKGKVTVPHENSDDVVIGLRVYTHRDVACSVRGRLRKGCEDPMAG